MDRGALDAAQAVGLETGGWCPQGRRAEDGVIPADYPLREHPSSEYSDRTRYNVRDSDATLLLTCGRPSGGTAYTLQCARDLGRPHRVVDLDASPDAGAVRRWLETGDIGALNVAGPRESKAPGVGARARAFLMEVWR